MFAMGGIMGAGTKMMAAGLSMGQVQGVTARDDRLMRAKRLAKTRSAKSSAQFPD